MKRVNTSTKNMGQYAGKWVVIDPVKDFIIATGVTLKDIAPLLLIRQKKKFFPWEKHLLFLVPER